MSNKKHKWRVTYEQLKRKYGDDLEAIIADYCRPVVHDYNDAEVISFLGEYRTRTDISAAMMKRLRKLDTDFAHIFKIPKKSAYLYLVKKWYEESQNV